MLVYVSVWGGGEEKERGGGSERCGGKLQRVQKRVMCL